MNCIPPKSMATGYSAAMVGILLLGCATEPSDQAEVSQDSPSEPTNQAVASNETSAPPRVSGETFRFAAYEGNIDTVQQALDSGADVNSADSEQKLTPLHMAAYNGHTQIVKLLLERGAKIDPRDHEGKTPLTHACTGPFQATVKILVERGADINVQDAVEGFTPLMMAAGLGETEVVRILLEHNADRNIRDSDGDRAIDHARTSGHREIISLLES